MFSLNGKTAVVTGGGRGIGRGIALAMAAAHARVVLTGRTASALESTAAEIRARGGTAITVANDLTEPGSIEQIVAAALANFDYIDCWVNNAGSADPNDVGPLMDLTPERWDRVVDLNLKAAFFAAQAAARTMRNGGTIVNISSRSGAHACPNTGQYGAAKAGLDNLTKTMAMEWGQFGIRVNGIAPGVVLTEANSGPGGSMSRPSRIQRQIETVPLRRLGSVEDIGWLAVYLASDEAAWLTGQTIQMNGGSEIPIGTLTFLHHVHQRLSGAAPQS
ncbi:MAG: SDR family NAD(P)-dependent oxidoreductase [Gammaproteobacteria bacterium]